EERLGLLRAGQIGAAPIGIDAGPVLHVVAVGFETPNHWVFGVEHEALGIVIARVERAVVAHLRGSIGAGVHVGAAGIADRSAAVGAGAARAGVRPTRGG